MPTKDEQTSTQEESPYATEPGQVGKPVGPEHDQSFHAPDFYDPKTGKRVETPWDSEQQKNDPGFDPKVMAGTVEQPQSQSQSQGPKGQDKTTGASGGEAGEHTTARSK